MVYVHLAVAIVAEVVATSALKASDSFSKLFPSLLVIVGFGIAFYSLTIVMKSLPVGVTYAIWSGTGVVLIGIVGAVVYKQIPDLPAIIGMGLIIAGVVVINLFSSTVSH
ncbi:MAG: multidrug efflux SMR transporter [Campylobacterota bacterium]|nr:multidrug efflux SMR transporter [Campylobacterota bacterium]